MMIRRLLSVWILLSFTTAGFAQSIAISIDKDDSDLPKRDFEVRTAAELGFLGVLSHQIQFSNDGTYFDYVEHGGQDVLFPFARLSLEVDFRERNTFVLLYQPLRLESTALLEDPLQVDGLVFPAGTSVDFLYNFPFYRVSYLRELAPESEKWSFGIGASLQIRNATISFESTDGTLFRTNRDTGPVPAFKFRVRRYMTERVYTELEADGMYAPVSYINGSDNEVVGAILDASLRQGLRVTDNLDLFFNARYLGGGAVGTSDDDPGPGDGYTRNWLSFLTISSGLVYHW